MTIRWVTDTHPVLWFMWDDPRLSSAASRVFEEAMRTGEKIGCPSVVLVEVVYLEEKSKIPSGTAIQLGMLLNDPNSVFQPVEHTLAMANKLTVIPRKTVPDMPDRMITTVALELQVPLITRDAKILRFAGVETIW